MSPINSAKKASFDKKSNAMDPNAIHLKMSLLEDKSYKGLST